MNKFKHWLVKKLIGKTPFGANLVIAGGLVAYNGESLRLENCHLDTDVEQGLIGAVTNMPYRRPDTSEGIFSSIKDAFAGFMYYHPDRSECDAEFSYVSPS